MTEQVKGAWRMKPVMILPRGEVSARDIARLNKNGFCVVEADDPSKVRFMDPPPHDYSTQEKAAIELCRSLLARRGVHTHSEITELLVEIIIKGSPLQRIPAPVKVKP